MIVVRFTKPYYSKINIIKLYSLYVTRQLESVIVWLCVWRSWSVARSWATAVTRDSWRQRGRRPSVPRRRSGHCRRSWSDWPINSKSIYTKICLKISPETDYLSYKKQIAQCVKFSFCWFPFLLGERERTRCQEHLCQPHDETLNKTRYWHWHKAER